MTCSAVWQLCRSISLKAVVNLLTERQTLEDGDYMHKAAKQAGAASLMEQPAAVSTSQGTFDTQVRLNNFEWCNFSTVTVWLSVFSLRVSSVYTLIPGLLQTFRTHDNSDKV